MLNTVVMDIFLMKIFTDTSGQLNVSFLNKILF